jgi:hypothetical protein
MSNHLKDRSTDIGTDFFSSFRPSDQDAHGEEVRDTIIAFLKSTMFSILPSVCTFMSSSEVDTAWQHVPFAKDKPLTDCLKWCLLKELNTVFLLQLFGLLRNNLVCRTFMITHMWHIRCSSVLL